MITFKEFLLEIFDKPYKIENSSYDRLGKEHSYYFNSPHDNYSVNIRHFTPSHADVAFYSHLGGSGKSNSEGNQSHRIYSTVHHVIKKHLEDHPNLQSIQFSSQKRMDNSDKSKTKLYQHFVNKMTRKHEISEDKYGHYWNIHKDDIK